MNKWIKQEKLIYGLILGLVVIVISLIQVSAHTDAYEPTGYNHTKYNNYVIFRNSFFHLIDNKDLYTAHRDVQFDLYKYSPTFALAMAPMAVLPDWLGLMVWNALNAFVLLFALMKIPMHNSKARWLMMGFVLLELVTSIQNAQSNALIAGLIIWAWHFLEKGKNGWAALMIVLTVYIKIFGVFAFVLFLFYPNKWRSFLASAWWSLILLVLPLIAVSLEQLTFLYQSWWHLLQNDHSISYGLSMAGWLHSWFGFEGKTLIISIGLVLFVLPLIQVKRYTEPFFKLLYLSMVLVWIVIFNHKAESPTFVIAASGVAIWYFVQEKNKVNMILMILALFFTLLAPTDIYPRAWRNEFFTPYVIKALPIIAIWVKMNFDYWKDAKLPFLR